MSITDPKRWRRGQLYELILLLATAECVWFIGIHLGVFEALHRYITENNLTDLLMLGFLMSFALIVAATNNAFKLRREILARTRAESRAQNLARHDVLTGMPNRRLMLEGIAHALKDRGADQVYGMFLIDLDKFKPINDIHGHAAGDAVLCEIAGRLIAILPQGGIAARIGGDEFAILAPCRSSADDPPRLAQKIIASLSAPIAWNSTQVQVSASVGIALAPNDATDGEALLRCADVAMYRAKREGRSTYRFFEQSMDEELHARAVLESELRAAIANNEIRPYYQSLINLTDRQLLGFEILARWYHPKKGVLAPDLFIEVAEYTGLIADMSYSLLRQACLDAKNWPQHLQLAINISPVQLKDPWLPERLLAILTETGFPPSRLEVEITETALINDLTAARNVLSSLHNVGIQIALDDFGTGYSSLYHLRELRFDKIKIDRSYVQSMSGNEESRKIVNAIVGLGKSLGLLTTAEGIESKGHLDWLTDEGCSFGQGFLFGAPMPAVMVSQMVNRDVSATPASTSSAAA